MGPDEHRARAREESGIGTRRDGARTFDSPVTRVEVLTCEVLPDNAERSLAADIEAA
ncbi:hypothetical protein AB0E62_09000 [Streptomyces sp. NPDC038707]|uniref:hypothetical protein n=1 Tax=unclassified Streptomyces TaxID=2593676 RepID=UPI003411DDD0